MRKLLLIAGAVASLAVSGTALANGPSGSSEPSNGNQVTCGSGTSAAGNTVYAGANGVEACSGDNSGIDGRVIATTDQGGYVAADGDGTNNSNATGYIRVDSTGAHCGHTPGNQDSTSGPQTGACP